MDSVGCNLQPYFKVKFVVIVLNDSCDWLFGLFNERVKVL